MGYSGRIGIFEHLEVGDEVRNLILQNVDANTIKKAARAHGFTTLREAGAARVAEGVTSAAEVLRVTQDDSFGI